MTKDSFFLSSQRPPEKKSIEKKTEGTGAKTIAMRMQSPQPPAPRGPAPPMPRGAMIILPTVPRAMNLRILPPVKEKEEDVK